jgi:hypothetical protein
VPREIDFIDAPLGLGARDTVVLLSLDAEDGQPRVELWIMHPERCMESRVINATDLHKTAPRRDPRRPPGLARAFPRAPLPTDAGGDGGAA